MKYFCNFVAKSDQKPKTKNGMNETYDRSVKKMLLFLNAQKTSNHYKIK